MFPATFYPIGSLLSPQTFMQQKQSPLPFPTSSNKSLSCAGCGTGMWDSPWSGWQQCPDSHLPVPEHQGSTAHTLPAQQNAGRQCGRQGEVRRALQYSLFSLLFFLIENAVWSQVQNNSPLSPPSFQGCSDVPGLQSQTRDSPAQRSLRGLHSSSQHRAHPDANKWSHSDSVRAQGSGVGSLLCWAGF